jgi:phosphopantothenoylcysteine synthetase/decarboxylase
LTERSETLTHQSVLYLIVCGSPASRGVVTAVELAQADGWEVCVVATPDGLKFIDIPAVCELTGHPVRHRYRYPGEPDVLPVADAMLVAPATVNTVNKWAAGIADTLALGLIVEGVGKGLPIVAMPFTNEAMARHPAFARSIADLRAWGVTVLWGNGEIPQFPPGSGESIVDRFPWRLALDAVKERAWRPSGADHW